MVGIVLVVVKIRISKQNFLSFMECRHKFDDDSLIIFIDNQTILDWRKLKLIFINLKKTCFY